MYSPFKRRLLDLNKSDLMDLQNAKEDWPVEYKGPGELDAGGNFKKSTKDAIAKGVASFANGDGGWLFLGIDEGKDRKPKLETMGIPKKRRREETIYQCVGERLFPPPFFRVQAVDAENNTDVFALLVPPSPDAPHLGVDKQLHVRYGIITRHLDAVTTPAEFEAEIQKLTGRAQRVREHVQGELKVRDYGVGLAKTLEQEASNETLQQTPHSLTLVVFPVTDDCVLHLGRASEERRSEIGKWLGPVAGWLDGPRPVCIRNEPPGRVELVQPEGWIELAVALAVSSNGLIELTCRRRSNLFCDGLLTERLWELFQFAQEQYHRANFFGLAGVVLTAVNETGRRIQVVRFAHATSLFRPQPPGSDTLNWDVEDEEANAEGGAWDTWRLWNERCRWQYPRELEQELRAQAKAKTGDVLLPDDWLSPGSIKGNTLFADLCDFRYS